jgi:hypothetical protein
MNQKKKKLMTQHELLTDRKFIFRFKGVDEKSFRFITEKYHYKILFSEKANKLFKQIILRRTSSTSSQTDGSKKTFFFVVAFVACCENTKKKRNIYLQSSTLLHFKQKIAKSESWIL